MSDYTDHLGVVHTAPSFEERKREFVEYFCTGNLSNIKQKALSGELRNSWLRSLAWKVFLGCLPQSSEIGFIQWRQVMSIHRKEYAALLKQYLVDPRQAGRELDPLINNPLSQSEDSPWFAFFQNAELEKEIDQDIQRTYPEHEFFQQKSVREMMLRILFIYARQTPQLSYKQGMHELLAPIIYLIHRESIENEHSKDPLDEETKDEEVTVEDLHVLLDRNFVEHDAFTLFSHLMKIVKPWFQQDNKQQMGAARNSPAPFSGSNNLDDITSPVVEKCKFIQNVILRDKDPQLYQKLIKLNIEPQLYMLRWVRLLLGREFHLEDVMILWDAMFSFGSHQITDLRLIDYISVAMLIYIRQHILEQDYTGCLRRLFKYPPVEDVHLFVEQGIALSMSRGPLDFGTSSSSPATGSPSTPANKALSPGTRERHRSDRASLFLDPLANAVKAILDEDPASNPQHPYHHNHTNKPANKQSSNNNHHSTHQSHHAPSHHGTGGVQTAPPQPESEEAKKLKKVEADLAKLQNTQSHMANRLERIIYSMQKEIVDSGVYESATSDAVMIALAEMKQIRDILSGLLPVEQFGSNLQLDSEEMNKTILYGQMISDAPKSSDPLGIMMIPDDNNKD